MKKGLWKYLFFTGVLCALAGAGAWQVSAEEGQIPETQSADIYEEVINCGENDEWLGIKHEDQTMTVVGRRHLDWAEDKTIEIPAEIEGFEVTDVREAPYGSIYSGSGFYVFSPEVIETIKFPDTVVYIEDGIFSEFPNLHTVYLPDNGYGGNTVFDTFEGCTAIETVYTSAETMHSSALQNSVKTINYYEGTETIKDGGFSQLTAIHLPASVQSFGWEESPNLSVLNSEKAIEDIQITSTYECPRLCIPVNAGKTGDISYSDYSNSGITSFTADGSQLGYVAKSSFLNCPNLESISITNNSSFFTEDGALWWKDENGHRDLFVYPAGRSYAGNYNIPENTHCIYLSAFDSCSFTSYTFPENLDPAFYFDSYADAWSGDYLFEGMDVTVRVVPGSSMTRYNPTREDLAEELGITAANVEYYYGNTYRITYNLNGGVNAAGNPDSYQAGRTVTLQSPSKTGSVFVGWLRSDVPDEYCSNTERNEYFKDLTFTAVWSETLPYPDVQKNAWYYDYVKYVFEKGLMTGKDDGTFAPGENLARAQFALILYRMEGEPAVDSHTDFPDVPVSIWYSDAVAWAAQNGIVTGYSDTGCFGPNDPINREQMATMMYRYAKYKGYDTSADGDLSGYPDAASVNAFAREGMSWCTDNKIITGDNGRLNPQNSTNRAECATIISRFSELKEH